MFVMFMCLVFAVVFVIWVLGSLVEWWHSFTFAEELPVFKSVVADYWRKVK